MRVQATIVLNNKFPVTSDFLVIDRDGENLLVFQTLVDGTRLCLRLDGVDIQCHQDPWGEDRFYAGSIDASPNRAVVIPNAS